MPEYREADIDHLIEIPGIYDGWSIARLKDGRVVNRWAGIDGYEQRAGRVQAYIERWFTDEPSVQLPLFEEES